MGLHRRDVTVRSTASCALCLLSDVRTYIHQFQARCVTCTIHPTVQWSILHVGV